MARNTNTVTMAYDELFLGEVAEPVTVTISASQTIKRGDLLECVVTSGVPATSFNKPSTTAVTTNLYAIAADAITTSGSTGKLPVYIRGIFNANKVSLGGSSTLAQNYNVLLDKGIILKTPQSK